MSTEETRMAGSDGADDALDPTIFERLAAVVAADPGSPHFPALVEAHRRAGRIEAALRTARAGLAAAGPTPEGELALALALYEAGEDREARALLARRLDPLLAAASELPPMSALAVEAELATPGFEAVLADAELDQAFESAESEPDQMFDVNRVAEQVLEAEPADGIADFALGSHPRFATETMATLLESQGDTTAAASIRAGLDRVDDDPRRADPLADTSEEGPAALAHAASAPITDAAVVPETLATGPESGTAQRRERILDTLERWLANIRREVV